MKKTFWYLIFMVIILPTFGLTSGQVGRLNGKEIKKGKKKRKTNRKKKRIKKRNKKGKKMGSALFGRICIVTEKTDPGCIFYIFEYK